ATPRELLAEALHRDPVDAEMSPVEITFPVGAEQRVAQAVGVRRHDQQDGSWTGTPGELGQHAERITKVLEDGREHQCSERPASLDLPRQRVALDVAAPGV